MRRVSSEPLATATAPEAAPSAAAAVAVPAPGVRAPGLRDRLVNLAYAGAAFSPLGLAWSLDPSPHGVGTHRQLGLPPCTFLYLTGMPCPFCGMTTSWSHAAHLSPLASLRTQPMGFVFFVIDALLVAYLVSRAASGRSGFQPDRFLTAIPLWLWYVGLAGVLLAWGYKISLVAGWLSLG